MRLFSCLHPPFPCVGRSSCFSLCLSAQGSVSLAVSLGSWSRCPWTFRLTLPCWLAPYTSPLGVQWSEVDRKGSTARPDPSIMSNQQGEVSQPQGTNVAPDQSCRICSVIAFPLYGYAPAASTHAETGDVITIACQHASSGRHGMYEVLVYVEMSSYRQIPQR